MSAPLVILAVRWRGTTYSLHVTPETPMSTVRNELAALTAVPPSRQTFLLPGRRSRPADDEPLSNVFPSGLPPSRPVTMLGSTPASQAAADAPAPVLSDNEVLDDLAEAAAVVYVAPRPPPMPVPRRAWSEYAGPAFPAPGLVGSQIVDVEEVAQEAADAAEAIVPEANNYMTNGAALRLEDVDDGLSSALVGAQFAAAHLDGALTTSSALRFMTAVTESKAALKMLAVVLLDMSTAPSQGFVADTLQAPPVAVMLNENFVVFAADVSALPGHGAALLGRLGLHSMPAVLLLSDVGSGVGIVDMFATDYYSSVQIADAVVSRLLETMVSFEFCYEAARARRAASNAREDIISKQDSRFAEAQAADRARAQAEEEATVAAATTTAEKAGAIAAAEAVILAEEAAAVAEIKNAASLLPEQPEVGSGARVAVRLPDGRRVDRRFAVTDTSVNDIFNWCVSLGVRHGSFALSMSYPRKVLTLERDGPCSLEAAGLLPTAALLVDML
jgi:UBX domain